MLVTHDSAFSPQIVSQRNCPKSGDAHHREVVCTLLYLDAAGLEPVSVSMGCGCKMKIRNIPDLTRVAVRERRLAKKPSGGKSTSPRTRMSTAEKRKRFDEAQLKLPLYTSFLRGELAPDPGRRRQ